MRRATLLILAIVATGTGVKAQAPSATSRATYPAVVPPATRPRITPSKVTTFFTAPLRADGTVDYVKALE